MGEFVGFWKEIKSQIFKEKWKSTKVKMVKTEPKPFIQYWEELSVSGTNIFSRSKFMDEPATNTSIGSWAIFEENRVS